MDWIKEVLEIKIKLKAKGFDNEANEITNAQLMLGTPGEMYLEVMNELLRLKTASPHAYSIVEKEIARLLEFGRSLDYFNHSK